MSEQFHLVLDSAKPQHIGVWWGEDQVGDHHDSHLTGPHILGGEKIDMR